MLKPERDHIGESNTERNLVNDAVISMLKQITRNAQKTNMPREGNLVIKSLEMLTLRKQLRMNRYQPSKSVSITYSFAGFKQDLDDTNTIRVKKSKPLPIFILSIDNFSSFT